MSYKDLKEARAKRAKKEAAKEAKVKGKYDADASEPNTKVVRMSRKPVREDEIVPDPFRALVAQMW